MLWGRQGFGLRLYRLSRWLLLALKCLVPKGALRILVATLFLVGFGWAFSARPTCLCTWHWCQRVLHEHYHLEAFLGVRHPLQNTCFHLVPSSSGVNLVWKCWHCGQLRSIAAIGVLVSLIGLQIFNGFSASSSPVWQLWAFSGMSIFRLIPWLCVSLSPFVVVVVVSLSVVCSLSHLS